jgi:hypothetical protein
MPTFATIIELYPFKEVTFYTVKIEGETASLGSQFIESNKSHKHIKVLITWLQNIGNNRGALAHLFRSERKADALPPPIEITQKSCSLRWYCLRMSRSAVILFNGGEKTKGINDARDCPVVGPHFNLANQLCDAIWDAFDKEVFEFDKRDRLTPKNIRIEF